MVGKTATLSRAEISHQLALALRQQAHSSQSSFLLSMEAQLGVQTGEEGMRGWRGDREEAAGAEERRRGHI